MSTLIAAIVFSACAVTHVADGDTLTVKCSERVKPFTLRLNAVDAPELAHPGFHIKAQPFGAEAARETTAICLSKRAVVHRTGTDRYGRALGSIECEGRDLQMDLVAGGFAWVSPEAKKGRERQLLAKIMGNAQEAHNGLWADPAPVAPWTWRKQP